ncbi:DNA primase [Buchnera aphidicola]|uniref:DNA primase n=1 Tax=Buchnera aphidicola (Cinara strobi) TaxID=1921549 RepID=A0A3B1DVG5_9GAMM|nr:DNA primase [Buchnera aphidicola]VAX76243.1 DNA primase [Buchnera aphidicola (Cinara strobi)]
MIIKKPRKKIPQNFIHELIERTDIVELINKHLSLKKTGNNYKTLCPFHYEKTPSFTVNPQKQFFYCFGCGVHGNAIDFLIKHEKLDFLSSIKELTELNGIDLPYIQKNSELKKKYFYKKNIYFLLKKISSIYKKNLLKIPNEAYSYLVKRGITYISMKKFSLGFAISENNQITNYIKEKTAINTSILIDCGISIQNIKNNYIDRFKKRIIFPIKDQYGRIKGFGGRIVNDKNYPKYLNSPETITFHKKKNLYGIYELYLHNPKPKKILVVEGYLDVISLTQFKINYAVALLGTIITSYQVKKLFQISKNIIFCFDGDDAGRKANWALLNTCLPFLYDHYKIDFLLLPNNEDPSSLIHKEGKKKFEKRIQQSEPLYSFLFKRIPYKINFNCIQDCIKLSLFIIPLIKKIPSTVIKIHLRKILGDTIGILDTYQLKKLIKIKKKNTSPLKIKTIKMTTMRLLISLIIQNPILVKKIKNIKKIQTFQINGKSIFIDLIQLIIKKKIFKTGHLLEFYRFTKWEKIFQYFSIWDHMISKKNVHNIFKELLHNLEIQDLEYQYNQLIIQEKKNGLNTSEKKKLWNITKKLIKIKNFIYQ